MYHLCQLSGNNSFQIVQIPIHLTRTISKYTNPDLTSKSIRKKFLDYFIKEHNHKFVRSSPVVPYCDSTVDFVNAGMNQFKGILLGTQQPRHKRVANTQKCIRIGGKHNDLSIVGVDGYHHTFFEMMGNWSFGDYFKAESCKLAWDLLTKVYKLPKKRLYVTYFKGDEQLGLGEDVETKEIWRSIGVSSDRILPFGLKENFWEMGLAGPCGPCTEIHYDHLGGVDRSKFVNKGLYDLVEIWNLVFIEYNRLPDRSITKLPQKHVDTGMGFERLTAVLQEKISNYDTDNFQYLLKAIHKNCRDVSPYEGLFGEKDWNNKDKSYRTMADHVRMITVSLGDGVIPEETQKLRKIMRKTFLLSENNFNRPKGLVKELSNYVVENLGPVYPELEKNLIKIHQIIDYEENLFDSLRNSTSKDWKKLTDSNPKLLQLDITETPSFIKAYKDITSNKIDLIDSRLAFKLYDTHGLDVEGISKLAIALDLKFDSDDFYSELDNVKYKSKQGSVKNESSVYNVLVRDGVPKSVDRWKYSYSKEKEYAFDDVRGRVLKIFRDNESLDEIRGDHYCTLVLDQTNFYAEAGGQIGDRGLIKFQNSFFEVANVENLNGYVLHHGFYKSTNDTLKTNTEGTLTVDTDFRLSCMRNHTAVHLLNAVLKKLKSVVCQRSSRVTDKYLKFDVAIFGEKLSKDNLMSIENGVLDVIKKGERVDVKEIDSQELLGYDDVTLIPGEVYPETGIRLVEVKSTDFISREPCCGTHVFNTADLDDFCLTHIKSLGRSTASLYAVTGDRAKEARKNGAELREEIESLGKQIDDNIDKRDLLNMMVSALRKKLNYNPEDSYVLPLKAKLKGVEDLNTMSQRIDNIETETLKDFIEMEMQSALESNIKMTKSNQKYLIHYLRSSTMLDNVPLQKATKLCPDYPILVIAYVDNTVKARCCVPKKVKTDNFNAEKWMKEIAQVFRSRAAPPKGQDGTLVCNMKAKRINVQDLDTLLKDSLNKAEKYIEDNL